MAEIAMVPQAMRDAAEALMQEAMKFAAANVHPDHRDGGEDEALATRLEAAQNSMTAILNAAAVPHERNLQIVGALIGTVMIHYPDMDAALEVMMGQAGAVIAQFGVLRSQGNA